jgi:hypothetical protein
MFDRHPRSQERQGGEHEGPGPHPLAQPVGRALSGGRPLGGPDVGDILPAFRAPPPSPAWGPAAPPPLGAVVVAGGGGVLSDGETFDVMACPLLLEGSVGGTGPCLVPACPGRAGWGPPAISSSSVGDEATWSTPPSGRSRQDWARREAPAAMSARSDRTSSTTWSGLTWQPCWPTGPRSPNRIGA